MPRRDQIADTLLTLLFAGHDTSSTTLVRIFQHLHAHPEAVSRLQEEQVCTTGWWETGGQGLGGGGGETDAIVAAAAVWQPSGLACACVDIKPCCPRLSAPRRRRCPLPQAEVLARHGPVMSEAALDDMRYTDGVLREAMRITPIIAGFPRLALKARYGGVGRDAEGGGGGLVALCWATNMRPAVLAHVTLSWPAPARPPPVQDFELCGHTVPKGTRMQCSLAQPLLTDARCAFLAQPPAVLGILSLPLACCTEPAC